MLFLTTKSSDFLRCCITLIIYVYFILVMTYSSEKNEISTKFNLCDNVTKDLYAALRNVSRVSYSIKRDISSRYNGERICVSSGLI